MPKVLSSIRPTLFVALASLMACDDSDASPAAKDADASPAADAGSNTQAHTASKSEAGRAPAVPVDAGTSAAAKSSERDEQAIKLRFHAQVADEPFACGHNYAAQGSSNTTVTPRDLRLFIQDVALVDDKGNEVPVKLDTRDPWQTPEVALLDFEDSSGECLGNTGTNAEITGVVPKGSYTALRFSNGVPDALNHADPKKFPAPLKTPGMSWNWLLGLRFLRFELATQAMDNDTDAGANATGFALHVGSTACSGSQNEGNISCSKPNRSRIELQGFDVDKSEIVLDVSPLLRGADLSKLLECHSASTACEPMFQALGVSFETGKPTTEQRVFRLK